LIAVASSGDGIGDRATGLRRLIAADSSAAEDLVGLLSHVCRIAAAELTASGVGVSVMTGDGGRSLYAASDALSERFEDLQFLLGEGPCIEAFDGRRPVLIADLSSDALQRWPLYAPVVYEDGLRAVFAFPLQVGAARLGVMDVFREQSGPLTQVQLSMAFLVADIIVETLLDRHESHSRQRIAGGLTWSVGNRAQLFQAQGMVMVQLGISLAEAMVRMRAYAFAEDRRLDDVARDVVNRTLRFDHDTT
jgi:GAF domain-containing protein